MKNGYNEGLSIDRIDNNGNYTPENCRWVDGVTQRNNMRKNIKLSFNGKTQSVAQWARELGYNPTALYYRINKGKSIEEILSPPDPRYSKKKP